jgi:diguanylate cyclase (GGDEF)-like protein
MAIEEKRSGRTPFAADQTPVLRSPSAALRPGATVDSILTAIGETVYEWDLSTDALAWAENAAAVLGFDSMDGLATGKRYGALVDPDSVTNRHEAVLNGIGIDHGAGVPYEIAYALRLAREGETRAVWVTDCGLWFADAEGRPVLARGVVRRSRSQAVWPIRSAASELPRRAEFVKLLENVFAVARHYLTRYAFVMLSIDNMPSISDAFGPMALDDADAVIVERLRTALRTGDHAGRLSDAEIGLILRVGDANEARLAVPRVLRAIGAEPIPIGQKDIVAAISAGVVMIPIGAASVEECLARARQALSEARERGPGGHAFHPASRRSAWPSGPDD